ncbi:ATP-binding cassette domain-containing protein [Gluconacetobacter entanii]|uniref:ABC transporter ATP-binding protein/permease n=1 Tax=Gluconacetobacter entanii TaxID=108528 RepID=UPI001C9353EC|nr:SbmA/BacA-like family transporter [Gluconacetobacter entanii]MBY4641164.1 ATP-binding cassette domain-containing protein [Gluconacetobacter entanii]MCW4579091.1 ATP-binding cassette domain-containing protein [Gluconacetobacter entanii]MCW4582498.1 ATP-binding cassette domain-containing protein [Gluconacetobacter entanii]MCW4585882.1 ATP-binding cassette domain-containing protein [Gluconacetobacter entanii]
MQRTDPPARHSIRHSLSDWAVLLPYWRSREKWVPLAMLATIVGLSFVYVRTAVWFGRWNQHFFDAMFAYRVETCLWLLPAYIGVCILSSGCYVLQTYLTQVLSMRWRLWNTRVYLRQYLSDTAYYRMEHGAATGDNPDQRIADDLSQMTVLSLRMGLDGIQAVTTLLSFSIVLWDIGGSIDFTCLGHHIHVSGYLLLGTVLATLGASVVMERLGSPLVEADYRQQHFDADLRADLLDLRRNSEQIAFYRGEDAEKLRLSHNLRTIAHNWRSVVTYTWRANFVGDLFNGTASIILWVLLLPRLAAHALTFGEYSRINAAFMQVRRSLQWFMNNYTDLATLRSVLQRLHEFERTVRQPSRTRITRIDTQAPGLDIHDLVLDRPDGGRLVRIPALHVGGGERWLVRGASGSGKSTLLRAIAGLWEHGHGTIALDIGDSMFLPQRAYLPPGSLRAVLAYPRAADSHEDARYAAVLRTVNLDHHVARLDETAQWDAILSPGEAQRIAIARVLLQRPGLLFMDEATAALDADNTRRVHAALLAALPRTTIISISHHDGPCAFYPHELLLEGGRVTTRIAHDTCPQDAASHSP